MPKIVSLSPPTQAAAGITPNRATIKDIEAALLRAPNFLASLGLSDEADLADLLKIPLGSGHYAYAFLLPNGTVLKVTDDEDDARVCKLILDAGNGLPGLPYIQSVNRLPGDVYEHETDEDETRPIFAIVMESVTLASRVFGGMRPRLLGEVVLYPSMESELPSETAREFVRVIRRGIHWLAAHGVSVVDLHHNNFGYASGKRPVIIDFGHGSLQDEFVMSSPIRVAMNPRVDTESRAQAFKRLRAANNRCAAALKRIDTKLGVGDIMKALDLAESEEQFRTILAEYSSRMAKISPENAARREQIKREWEDTIDEAYEMHENPAKKPTRAANPVSDELLREIERVAQGCYDPDDAWCVLGSEAVSELLTRHKIDHAHVAANFSVGMGGVKIDDSHEYIVLLPSGWIIDPTIRQFIDAGHPSKEQVRVASGYPFNKAAPLVALIAPDDPFVEKMGYDSHLTGRPFTRYYPWMRVSPNEWMREQRALRDEFAAQGSLMQGEFDHLKPNGRPSMPHVRAAFDECFDSLLEQFPDFGDLELHEDEKAGGDNGHGSERQFGYCMDGKPIRVAFAAKTEDLPVANIRGLMAHEFGHALDYRYGDKLGKMLGQRLPEGVERRADSIAKAVFGRTIKYDGKDIQCVACQGKSVRPRRLG